MEHKTTVTLPLKLVNRALRLFMMSLADHGKWTREEAESLLLEAQDCQAELEAFVRGAENDRP